MSRSLEAPEATRVRPHQPLKVAVFATEPVRNLPYLVFWQGPQFPSVITLESGHQEALEEATCLLISSPGIQTAEIKDQMTKTKNIVDPRSSTLPSGLTNVWDSILTFFALQDGVLQGTRWRRLALQRAEAHIPIHLVFASQLFLPKGGLGGGDLLCAGDAAAGHRHLRWARLLEGKESGGQPHCNGLYFCLTTAQINHTTFMLPLQMSATAPGSPNSPCVAVKSRLECCVVQAGLGL